ncbi:MAG: NAD-binding protein [Clostridia bacterium]|nr:NAD-binding protein [Clostridia bacterium]
MNQLKEPLKIAVLGGDARQRFAAKKLVEDGYSVSVWGLGNPETQGLGAVAFSDWRGAISEAEALLLPLPVSGDGVRLNCPLQSPEESVRLSLLIESFEGALILGGKIPPAVQRLAEEKGISCIDYFDSELLQLKNALPTAEGAIHVAMGELPVTLDGCRVAVVGYGRIGSLLAEKLQALGAEVTVLARRREVLQSAALRHQKGILLRCEDGYRGLDALPSDCRVIFNTVPKRIFVGDALEKLPKSCLFVDLASAPGGIDFTAAEAKGMDGKDCKAAFRCIHRKRHQRKKQSKAQKQ